MDLFTEEERQKLVKNTELTTKDQKPERRVPVAKIDFSDTSLLVTEISDPRDDLLLCTFFMYDRVQFVRITTKYLVEKGAKKDPTFSTDSSVEKCLIVHASEIGTTK